MKQLLNKIKKITSGAVSAVLCISGVSWSGLKSTDAAGSVEDKWIFREANNAASYSDRISDETIHLDWEGTPSVE